ncbi:MAG: hypothetical protein JWN38_1136 [Candidatus Saccharibacteria bacterium]|nr:hypothetical protein [Candidatus Saccharibacteria bacterium]
MPTTCQAQLFRSDTGKSIVYLNQFVHEGDLLYSPDGTVYHTLVIHRYEAHQDSDNIDEHVGAEDLLTGVIGVIHRVNDRLVFRGEDYHLRPGDFDPSELRILSLPSKGRHPLFLCQARDGSFVYVSSATQAFGLLPDSIKLYFGTADALQELEIMSVVLHRDGDAMQHGTVYINTYQGMFYGPTTSRADRPVPMWQNNYLSELNPNDYHFVEQPDGTASFTKRKGSSQS